MPKKFFLSFLGPTPYQNTDYYWLPDRSDTGTPIPYVQEAIIRKCLPDWSAEDKIYLFTTNDAKENNYDNRNRREGVEKGKGLKNTLSSLQAEGRIHHFESIIIPEGHNEEELFRIFQIIFDTLEPEAEIYLDITFSFRSLPMLGIVLLNYAKNVIEAKVKAIYYGNYEAGRAEQQLQIKNAQHKQLDQSAIEQLKQRPVRAPILNLLSLSILQDWTVAANEFIKLGKATSLANLVQETQPDLAKQLVDLEQSIATCRGQLLTQELDVTKLKKRLLDSQNESIQEQLKPLLNKIEQKIKLFEDKKILGNGFAAVEWCIQHGMVQQGITFLLETLVSFLIEKTVGPEKIKELRWRDFAGGALKGFQLDKFKPQYGSRQMLPAEQDIYWLMTDEVNQVEGLVDLTWELVGKEGIRNDINHGGFTPTYLTPEALTEKLRGMFTTAKSFNLK
jgi:CRISPR-associated DxTHG motif protein